MGTANCLNCGAVLQGAFCAACGQDAAMARLDSRALARDAIEDVLNFDTRLLRTMRALTVAPGKLCLDYVQGKRAPWFPPLRYFLAMLAAVLLVMLWVGFDPVRAVAVAGDDARMAQVRAAIAATAMRHLNLAMAMLVPLHALVLRALFRRSGHNYAEAGVFALYTLGHCLAFALLIEPLKHVALPVAIALRLAFQWLYTAWAARVFFGVGTFTATWRCAVATVAYFLLQNLLILAMALPTIAASW
jgi:hypothetical protein